MAARTTRTAGTAKMNAIDRLVAYFAPARGRARLAARVATSAMARAYDGAATGRGTDGWITSASSADAEIAAAGTRLRSRMRDLVRNSPMAANAIQVLVNNIVGTGIMPRANTGDPNQDKAIDAAFRAWARDCDAHGHTNFGGLQALAVREMLEGGEVFALKRPLRANAIDKPGDIPLRVELREADFLDDGKTSKPLAGNRIIGGIEYDQQGRRVAYWMHKQHPGDSERWVDIDTVRVPADRVAHLFERQRVQNRGVPWGTPALRALRDLDDWQVAELVRKKTEACMVGVVFSDDDTQQGVAPSVQDADGNMIEKFEPGLIAYAHGGKDIRFNQPSTAGGVQEWNRVQQHIIAAGFRVPYALLTGDLSQTNFASSRVGLNEFRRMVRHVQEHIVIPMFCAPIWSWFVEMGAIAGRLPDGTIPVKWTPPRFESVNPLQDAQADLLEVRAGFSTLHEQIARRGRDPEEVIGEWNAAAKMLDDLSLVVDSDPRKVAKSGLSQPIDVTGDPNKD